MNTQRNHSRAGEALRIVVLGFIVRGPVGGMAWHHLQYVHGLRRLGHDVLFVEDSGDSEWSCYNPTTGETGSDASFGIAYADKAFTRLGLGNAWAYWEEHTGRWLGARARDAEKFCRSADLVLNISGVNPLREWTANVPRRAFVDTDPVFTQVKHLTERGARELAQAHNAFFTFGENFGRPGCTMPADGFPWRATRQPVVLDDWKVTPPPPDGAFSTVMLWESYPAREYGGVSYGMKSKSFAAFRDLPRKTTAPLELALGGADLPWNELKAEGWRLVEPLEVALDPWQYQDYIHRSAGEFGVAKHGYASTRCGWFSERTAAYLASGRPAIVQCTGFVDWLQASRGLFAFTTPEEALAALAVVRSDLPAHGRAAREIASEYFDSDKVLRRLVDQAMSSDSARPEHAGVSAHFSL